MSSCCASLLRRHLPVALLHPLRLSWTLVRKRRKGVVIWDRCGTVQRSSSGPLWWRPPSSLFFNHFQLPDQEGLCFIRQLSKHDVAIASSPPTAVVGLQRHTPANSSVYFPSRFVTPIDQTCFLEPLRVLAMTLLTAAIVVTIRVGFFIGLPAQLTPCGHMRVLKFTKRESAKAHSNHCVCHARDTRDSPTRHFSFCSPLSTAVERISKSCCPLRLSCWPSPPATKMPALSTGHTGKPTKYISTVWISCISFL